MDETMEPMIREVALTSLRIGPPTPTDPVKPATDLDGALRPPQSAEARRTHGHPPAPERGIVRGISNVSARIQSPGEPCNCGRWRGTGMRGRATDFASFAQFLNELL